jgi:NADH-quinone oxidoreductase subunit C
MSSTESKDNTSKEENKPAPPKPAAEKPAPPKPAAEKPAPPKPEETLPAFEKEFTDRIINQFAGDAEVGYVKENRTRINVKKEKILDVAKFIKDQTPFDHAESMSGVDFPDDKEIEVVYHLGSYTDNRYSKQILALSTRASREENPNPGNDSTKLPSLRDIFYSVEFHERECFEMLGVYFDGHPDNRRLLLPEDWADIPPLRKDFRNKGR